MRYVIWDLGFPHVDRDATAPQHPTHIYFITCRKKKKHRSFVYPHLDQIYELVEKTLYKLLQIQFIFKCFVLDSKDGAIRD